MTDGHQVNPDIDYETLRRDLARVIKISEDIARDAKRGKKRDAYLAFTAQTGAQACRIVLSWLDVLES